MIVEVEFKNGATKAFTKTLHQFDKDITLMLLGIALSSEYYVHLSNDEEYGLALSCKGDEDGVVIPDGLFVNGEYIYGWVRDENATKYSFVIPIERKPVAVPIKQKGSSVSGFIYNEDDHSIEWIVK